MYKRQPLKLEASLAGKKLYREFLGANSVCTVYLNQQLVGIHRGGYSTFRFEITKYYDWNGENLLAVLVDNSETDDVSPLFGDFTIFGGLYREVRILAVPETHFDAAYYGTQGVRLLTEVDEQNHGTVYLEARIAGPDGESIRYDLYGPDGTLAASASAPAKSSHTVLHVNNVCLWNGTESPAFYLLRRCV